MDDCPLLTEPGLQTGTRASISRPHRCHGGRFPPATRHPPPPRGGRGRAAAPCKLLIQHFKCHRQRGDTYRLFQVLPRPCTIRA